MVCHSSFYLSYMNSSINVLKNSCRTSSTFFNVCTSAQDVPSQTLPVSQPTLWAQLLQPLAAAVTAACCQQTAESSVFSSSASQQHLRTSSLMKTLDPDQAWLCSQHHCPLLPLHVCPTLTLDLCADCRTDLPISKFGVWDPSWSPPASCSMWTRPAASTTRTCTTPGAARDWESEPGAPSTRWTPTGTSSRTLSGAHRWRMRTKAAVSNCSNTVQT